VTGTVSSESIGSLVNKIKGGVILPDDADYEHVRRVWNFDVDQRPLLIIQCLIEDDVRHALEFAQAHDLPISIRGGGHSFAGHGTCDGGVVINLSLMKRLRIDPHQRHVSLEPGVVGSELDQVTQAFGLAVPLGSVHR
jgi:FAD/FMN-containing dehydrogenase